MMIVFFFNRGHHPDIRSTWPEGRVVPVHKSKERKVVCLALKQEPTNMKGMIKPSRKVVLLYF